MQKHSYSRRCLIHSDYKIKSELCYRSSLKLALQTKPLGKEDFNLVYTQAESRLVPVFSFTDTDTNNRLLTILLMVIGYMVP